MKLKDIPAVLEICFENKIAVELKGPPGVGKTDVVRQFVAAKNESLGQPVGLVTEHLSTVESVDLRGFPHNDVINGVLVSRYASPPIFPNEQKFPNGIPHYGVLFLDEYMQAPMDVRKAAARLLEERKIGDYSLDDFGHWAVFAASNRTKDRSGTGKPMAFETNRKCEIHVEHDLDSWVDWALTHDVHGLFVAFAKANPGLVFIDEVPDHGKPFCTPRSFVRSNTVLASLANRLGTGHHGLPVEHPLAVEMVGGLIGEETAATMMAFLSMADQLASYDDIIASPKRAIVPKASRPDALYATSETIAFRAQPKHLPKLMQYINRMPDEFQAATVISMVKRAKDKAAIMSHKEMSKWLMDKSDLLRVLAD